MFRRTRLRNEYKRGRQLLFAALYQALVSTLADSAGQSSDPERIKDATANVLNRLALRPEARPDPRVGENLLAKELRDLSNRQMVREATALILSFDYGLEQLDGYEITRGVDRRTEAEKIGGPDFMKVWMAIEPERASPKVVRAIAEQMASHLIRVAEMRAF